MPLDVEERRQLRRRPRFLALKLAEASAPSGVADTVVLFAADNGSGKTKLMAQFPTGSAVQIAIEP